MSCLEIIQPTHAAICIGDETIPRGGDKYRGGRDSTFGHVGERKAAKDEGGSSALHRRMRIMGPRYLLLSGKTGSIIDAGGGGAEDIFVTYGSLVDTSE